MMLSILLAVLFSFLSSRVVNYDNLQEQLQTSGKGSGLQISKNRRNALVVSQIFLACLLLVGSSLVLGRAVSVINQPLGYDISVLRSFSLDERAGLIQADEMAMRDQYINEISSRLQQLPQIISVAPSFNTAIGYNMTMELIDRDSKLHGTFPTNFVAANYFETMQIPIIEGRSFNSQEVREKAPVAILSKRVAHKIAQGRSVLGMKFTIGGSEIRTVIGVADDVYDPVRNEGNQSLDAYLPHAPWNVHFIVRLRPDTELHREQLVSLIKDVNPGLRLANYREFVERHNSVIKQDKTTAGVAAGLSLLALLLAGTGIYGVLSYSSHMRRYELGVRMALGAKSHQISALVIKDNMQPITLGLILSLIVISIIYGVGHYQLGWFETYSLIPILLTLPIILITTFFASYFPIRSVIRNDPVKALRSEYT
jgi:ABC-type antimicrobial peptide transport system permease subunit